MKLVIDKNIASLPRRQTDEAIIIRSQDSDEGKARVFKLNATTSSDPILLERFLRNAALVGVFIETCSWTGVVVVTNGSTDFIAPGAPCLLGISQRHHLRNLVPSCTSFAVLLPRYRANYQRMPLRGK
jgi:hypothetical protein